MTAGISALTAERLRQGPLPGSTHMWLPQVAGGLKHMMTEAACVAFLRECCDRLVHHRDVPDREIESAVRFAYGDGTAKPRTPRWPAPNEDTIRYVLETIEPVFDGVTPAGVGAADVLTGLFEPGELVCSGAVCERPSVRTLEATLPYADRHQFIVVNPMNGPSALTLDGRPSARCQDNVVARRHLVAEFDDPGMTKPMQARLATALAGYAPLVLAVDSGGKSVHAWYRVDGMDPEGQARFFAVACLLGADRTRWDASGWLRMPGGLRRCSDGSLKRQRILYFKQTGGSNGRTGNTATSA